MFWKTTARCLLVAATCAPVVVAPRPLRAQPTAGAAAPRIATLEVRGGTDPIDRLQSYAAAIAPPGSFFVEAGDADRVGEVRIGTVPRLRRAFQEIGYDAVVELEGTPAAGLRLVIHLRGHDRIRHIFVDGNWPLRQDEIVRQLSVRPGHAVPLPGPDREAFVEEERTNVREYLRSQGYLEAEVKLALRGTSEVPSRINLLVDLDLGPGYPVGPVAVTGNRVIPSDEIEDSFHHSDWRWLWTRPLPFRLRLFRDDKFKILEKYRELGYASARIEDDYDPVRSIDPEAKHVRINLRVTEGKRTDVAFEGNERRSDEALRDVLTIFKNGHADDYEARASAAAIAHDYRERGHIFVRVTWRREPVGPGVERVVFKIDEGPALKVRGVTFVGNKNIGSEVLAEVVRTKPFPLIGALGIGEGGYASVRQLALDVDTIGDHYRSNGFPEVEVRGEMGSVAGRWRAVGPIPPAEEAEWRRANDLYVRFLIEEGIAERISEIKFERVGDKEALPLGETFLRKSLVTTVGSLFRPASIREDSGRLGRLFGDVGFPYASAEPQVTKNGGRVSLVWQIDTGPRVTVGPIFVRGNFLTRESTIMQWIRLRPGALLTTTALERSQRDLALVQLFNNASPIRFPTEGRRESVVPMLVEVEERHDHWGLVRVGGGASTEQRSPGSDFPLGFYASVGYEHRNLFGRGWTFDSEAAYGNSVTRANASFLDPRFWGTLFRLEVAGSYLEQATVRLGDLRSGGGSVGFSREMYPGVDAHLRYNLRNTLRTEFLLSVAGPFEDQRRVQIGTVVGSLSTGLEWQRLDNPLLPSRGFRLSGALELAHPSLSFHRGEDTFLKATARALAVVPLARRLSVRNSVRVDQGIPIGAPVLPKVERFFAGGDTTIRGFELDRARSEVIRSPVAPYAISAQYRPVGGSLRIIHNLDLQVPILQPWYAAVFLDSGVVADSVLGLGPREFRHAVGISPLVVKLPIGDLSVSWAWPLDPQPGDRRAGRLHLNVGLMF